MHRMTLILLAVTVWCAAPVAAAPICQNGQGDFVRCENKAAMPVGWHVPDDAYTARILSRVPRPEHNEVIAAAVVLACLFAIIALLPGFDGAKGEDWEGGREE